MVMKAGLTASWDHHRSLASAPAFDRRLRQLARDCHPAQFREEALALFRQIVPFEAGSWGSGRLDQLGICPSHAQFDISPRVASQDRIDRYLSVRGDFASRRLLSCGGGRP